MENKNEPLTQLLWMIIYIWCFFFSKAKIMYKTLYYWHYLQFKTPIYVVSMFWKMDILFCFFFACNVQETGKAKKTEKQ